MCFQIKFLLVDCCSCQMKALQTAISEKHTTYMYDCYNIAVFSYSVQQRECNLFTTVKHIKKLKMNNSYFRHILVILSLPMEIVSKTSKKEAANTDKQCFKTYTKYITRCETAHQNLQQCIVSEYSNIKEKITFLHLINHIDINYRSKVSWLIIFFK